MNRETLKRVISVTEADRLAKDDDIKGMVELWKVTNGSLEIGKAN